MSADAPLIHLMGPTAAGKTDLAVAMVARGPFDIVSVDSAMVYRELDIGTGKPDSAVLEQAPHRLIDIRNPDETYSAAEFARDARREIVAIRDAGRVPLLVGGTGLYFRALREGLSPLPPADTAVRARLEREGREHGWATLHARLARLDPTAAARIHPNDPQRIQRALEVFELTGRPISELQHGHAVDREPGVRVIVLEPCDRAALHRRIELRLRAMFERGLVEEVRGLRARWSLGPDMPPMRAVGYRQVWRHLDGEWSREEAFARALAATRQLARRQLTWLRAERGVERVDCTGAGFEARALDPVADLLGD